MSCANATQERLLGQDPYAVASPSNGYGTPNDLLPSAPYGFGKPTNPADAISQLLDAGHCSVGVLRINQGGTVEHVINAVNRDSKVFIIDIQLGHIVDLKPNVTVRLGTP